MSLSSCLSLLTFSVAGTKTIKRKKKENRKQANKIHHLKSPKRTGLASLPSFIVSSLRKVNLLFQILLAVIKGKYKNKIQWRETKQGKWLTFLTQLELTFSVPLLNLHSYSLPFFWLHPALFRTYSWLGFVLRGLSWWDLRHHMWCQGLNQVGKESTTLTILSFQPL